MVCSGEEATARSASHLARKKRVRWAAAASSALKKRKRSHAAALGRAQQPHRRQPVQLLDPLRRLVADRRRQVDDGVDAAQRLAHQVGIRHLAEVAEGDLHVDPALAEPPRLAHQAAHVLAALQQQRQQPRADAAGGPGQQQHGPASRLAASCSRQP